MTTETQYTEALMTMASERIAELSDENKRLKAENADLRQALAEQPEQPA
jgi:regulator of replication initiation timing